MPLAPPAGRIALFGLAAVVAGAAAAPAPAGAHASLVAASPSPGQELAAAPSRVTLQFSEPLNPRLSEAEIRRASGAPVPAAQRVAGGRRLVLSPRARLAPGAYRVVWRSLSTTDAHPLEGSFGFGVGVAAPSASDLETSPLAGAGGLRAASRGALYAALLAFAGGLLAQALLAGGRGRSWLVPEPIERDAADLGFDVADVAARGRMLTADAGVLAVGLAALSAAVEAFTAAGRIRPEALGDLLLTGSAGAARLGVVAFAVVALALAARTPRVAALAATAALGCVTASGHAGSADPRALALAADFSHLLAGAVWLGGGAILVGAWWPALRRASAAARRAVAAHMLPAFGAVAVPALAIVVVAGGVNAAVELGRLPALWQTGYGRVLMAKAVVVAVIAVAAYVHTRWLRPRLLKKTPPPPRADRAHWALLRAEPALGLAVAAAAGLLVAFPLPPSQLATAAERSAEVAACERCPLPAAAPDQLAVADLAGSQVAAAWLRHTPAGLQGTVRLLDFRRRPSRERLSVPGAATSPCGRGCLRFRRRGGAANLVVVVEQAGRRHAARLPARWREGETAAARRLLIRVERTMRSLRSLRELERVTSGPGSLATTEYQLRAPDRLFLRTGAGVRSMQIGRRQWLALPGEPWRRRDDLSAGAPFSTRSWFRWTPYASAVQLLRTRSLGGRRLAELALMDPGTPVWTRLEVELETGRVLRERLVTPGRLITHRFLDFNGPVTIEPPRVAG